MSCHLVLYFSLSHLISRKQNDNCRVLFHIVRGTSSPTSVFDRSHYIVDSLLPTSRYQSPACSSLQVSSGHVITSPAATVCINRLSNVTESRLSYISEPSSSGDSHTSLDRLDSEQGAGGVDVLDLLRRGFSVSSPVTATAQYCSSSQSQRW